MAGASARDLAELASGKASSGDRAEAAVRAARRSHKARKHRNSTKRRSVRRPKR